MKRIIMGVLMAATALMPVTASAQDRGDDGHGDGRQRMERRPDEQGGREDGGRPDYRGQQQGQPQWQRPDAQQAGFQGRPDRGGPDSRQEGFPRGGQDGGQRGWQGGRGDYRGNPGGAQIRGQYRDDRDYRQDRAQWDRRAIDRRDGYRDDRAFQERSAWNRGWRGDGRYDWNRYRDSNRGAYRLPRYYGPQGWNRGYQRFSIGLSLNTALFGRNYWIGDPYSYRLPDAYGPYRWVRYYGDALLVDLRSGRVVDAVYGIFW